MPQIKKILFPVDFSESSVGAARYLEFFAGEFEAEIMLLHAVGMGEHNLPEELLPARRAHLDAFLFDELKYYTTYRVCEAGEPAEVIAANARAWNPDLIMMPTHGLGFFRRHLLGSVTSKVLHDLPYPVWTSVHAERAPSLEQIHCRRILCALDLGDRSRCVLEWANWLAREYQATVGIVHATMAPDENTTDWQLGTEFRQYLAEQGKKEIEALQAQAGTDFSVFINPGDPARVIANAVADFNADLLVIGRHDKGGIPGLPLQSAYAILRESPCPVISI